MVPLLYPLTTGTEDEKLFARLVRESIDLRGGSAIIYIKGGQAFCLLVQE